MLNQISFFPLIVDTKFSVVYDKEKYINPTVSNQMEKYYDSIKSKLVILTFNQKKENLKTRKTLRY